MSVVIAARPCYPPSTQVTMHRPHPTHPLQLLVGYLHRRWRRGGGCGGGGSGRLLPVVKSPGVPDVHHGSSSISGSGAGSSGAGSSSGAGGWLQPRPLMLGAAVMAVWSVVNLAVTSQL